jgi:hypothetical protein
LKNQAILKKFALRIAQNVARTADWRVRFSGSIRHRTSKATEKGAASRVATNRQRV